MKIMNICAVIAFSGLFAEVRYMNATGMQGSTYPYWCDSMLDSAKQHCLEEFKKAHPES